MAKQHLYSRVPAKLSMFNRYDSYDTFAHSEGLTREFIEQELSCVYANKLSKNDTEAVRKGQMPLVYSQCTLRSGQVAQTCTHYLPLDYTGERSAYLSYTLILTDEEQKQLLCSQQNAVLNPRMFQLDASGFDFTSPSAAADNSCPEVAYAFCPVEDTREIIKQYDPDTFKRFLSAIFAVLCAKGKAVYFKLDCPDTELSEKALKLISAVMTVVPFHLRKHLSFVTYVTDPAQYPHVKVKCLPGKSPEVSPAKGAFLDLHTGLATGLLPDSTMESFPAAFFYSLLEDASLRGAFLSFMDNAVKTMPALEKLNIKALADLVFLFRGSSERFAQKDVLPTDAKVYDFLCVYEKYRSILDTESRKNAYACLARYPKRHEAIPKNIFTKLSRLYPDEPPCVKRTAIAPVLELLHTDIMRDKLFAFVKNNYSGVDADIRAAIHSDLCRVYYGGFLQPQILAFFSEHFTEEAEATQDAVLEKILLTIRTEAVQAKILAFVRANYTAFTARQKQAFYAMFFEMLPECDRLASLLIDLVNHLILQEPLQMQEQFRQKIQELLLADGKLLLLLCQSDGFCSQVVQHMLLSEQHSQAFFDDYIHMLSQGTAFQKAEALLRISDQAATADAGIMQRLIQALPKLFTEDMPQANLFAWLEADRLAAQAHKANIFASQFRETVIRPGIAMTLLDAFDAKRFPDGMDTVQKYAQENAYLLETAQYKILQDFWSLKETIENKDAKAMFQCLHGLLESPVRKQMAECIRVDLSKKGAADVQQYILYQMSIAVLRDGKLLARELYFECKDMCSRQDRQIPSGASGREDADVCAATSIFGVLTTACQVSSAFLQMLGDDQASLDAFLAECCAAYGNGGNKWILSCFADAPAQLYTVIENSLDRVKPKKASIFAKLFRSKK